MSTAPAGLQMEVRVPLSRPVRRGRRRPQPRQAVGSSGAAGALSRPKSLGTRPPAGDSRSKRSAGPLSLDTGKVLLETSDSNLGQTAREWRRSKRTEVSRYQEQCMQQKELVRSIYTTWQKWARKPRDPFEIEWWASYQDDLRPLSLEAVTIERQKHLEKLQKKDLQKADSYQALLETMGPEETPAERWARHQQWLKSNRPWGVNGETLRWEATYLQVKGCQTQWIGKRAACCGDKTPMIAVPVGCNHRLCPFCAWRRSQVARVRIRTLYDRLTIPGLITLTIPNQKKLSKHSFKLFRQRASQFTAQHKEDLKGGMTAIETTYSRTLKSWHVHAHSLVDLTKPLPSKHAAKVDFFGKKVLPFIALKWRWEYDWLCLWNGKWGKMPSRKQPKIGVQKWKDSWDGYWFKFGEWVRAKRAHSTLWAKQWDGTHYVLRQDLTECEIERYRMLEAWNSRNTIVIDIRPVTDREKVVKEVLKYITKVADFGHNPEAVEEFCNATRGVRMVQTWGSWYGVDLETVFDPAHLDDWGAIPPCACGQNAWENVGVLYRHQVAMDSGGRWLVKRPWAHNCAGMHLRPTIRVWPTPESEDQPYVQ